MSVKESDKKTTRFCFSAVPQMISNVGTISFGVLNEIIPNVTQWTMLVN